MAKKKAESEFDPYREALVVEAETVWPDDLPDDLPADRARLEEQLHAAPDKASRVEYVRQHTGFTRVITVTPQDLARLR